jgi:hypothetical protein
LPEVSKSQNKVWPETQQTQDALPMDSKEEETLQKEEQPGVTSSPLLPTT